jgi:hypothetical protein
MVRNKSKSKHKNNKKKELKLAENGEKYAYVRKNNGNTFTLELLNRESLTCAAERSVLRNGWLKENDVVIISSKTSKDSKYIITHHYTDRNHLKYLKENNLLNFTEKTNNQENIPSSNYYYEGDNQEEKDDDSINVDDQLASLIDDL